MHEHILQIEFDAKHTLYQLFYIDWIDYVYKHILWDIDLCLPEHWMM